MQNARPDESQARIKTADINNVRYADDTTSMAESEEQLKNFLVRVKGKGEKAKTQHWKNEDHGIWFHHLRANREKVQTLTDFIFLGSKFTVDSDYSHEIKMPASWKNSYDKAKQHIQKQTHHFAGKGPSSQSYGFPSSHIRTWVLDHKEGWAPKDWCFWTVVLEKTLESPLDCKDVKPVNPKGNQSWIFIGRTDAEAETPLLWPPDAKSWLTGKDPDAGWD